MHTLRYLAGYSGSVTGQVQQLINRDQLAKVLLQKYPTRHELRTNKALYSYVIVRFHHVIP